MVSFHEPVEHVFLLDAVMEDDGVVVQGEQILGETVGDGLQGRQLSLHRGLIPYAERYLVVCLVLAIDYHEVNLCITGFAYIDFTAMGGVKVRF